MKTTNFRFYRNSICKALVFAVLSNMVSVNDVKAMSYLCAQNSLYESVTETYPPGKIRVISHSMLDSPLVVVHIENPEQEKMVLLIVGSDKKVIFRQELGTPVTYASKFNLQKLPDNDYTLVVQTATYTHSKSFSLQTSFKRSINVTDEYDKNQVKQEAI